MKVLRAFYASALLSAPAWAVYAPIPEAAQGRALTAALAVSIYHDSNIFGGSTNEIDSLVYRLAPSLAFNSSISDQTFVSAGYGLTVDYVEDRPGDRDLISHAFNGRLAHAFSPRSTLDVSASYAIARNPESLLAGVPLNTDQSFKSAQGDGRYTLTVSERLGFTFKARALTFDYDNAALATSLDRWETLVGGSADFVLQPTTKLLGEYRYQTIDYDRAGGNKDKQSHFLLGGVEYSPGPKTSVHGRAGVEYRQRDGAPDEDAPYVEIGARYAYGDTSYISGGYALTFEETSNVGLYTDTQINRYFVNVQHALTPRVVASGLVTYEPSELQGRPGLSPDRDETTIRFGAALTYVAAERWTASATFDYDDVDSDDPVRNYDRTRFGVSARYVF